METNVEETTPAAETAPAEKPVRRRASRRVTAAAGEAPAAVEAAAPAAEAPAAEAPAAEPQAAAPAAEAPAEEAAAPKKRATRSRKKAAPAEDAAEAPAADAAPVEAPAAETAAAAPAAEAPAEEAAAPKKRATRSRKKAAPAEDAAEAPAADAAAVEAPAAAAPAADEAPAAEPAPAKRTRSRRVKAEASAPQADAEASETPTGEAAAAQDAQQESSEPAKAEAEAEGSAERSGRGSRTRRGRGQKSESTESTEPAEQASEDEANGRGQSQNGERSGANRGGSDRNGSDRNGSDRNGENQRSTRTRQRDRKRRGQGDEFEPELTEDDVLLPIAGILDVLDNYAFVRTSGYLPGTGDVYVSLGQVKKYGLRRGDAVVGAIRQPREGEGGGRQKYNAIVKVDTINGRPVEDGEKRVDVADLTPLYPEERLRLETSSARALGRAIDIAAPLGLGQRGLIVLPARVSGTRVLGEIAEAVSANQPEAHLVVVLTEALPEEVTRLQRSVRGEVVAATFDRPSEDQATVAELAIDRAKRLVELGHDVVVLVDSLGRLTRAFAQAQQAASRPAIDEVDEFALGQLRKLLAAGRNVENGGSLTLLATARTKTGVAADKVVLREARAVVNSEIRLILDGPGIDPVVDFGASWTRGAESMIGEAELAALGRLRAELADADEDAHEKLRASASNTALLAEIQRSGRLA
ncbi:transcription termination factor Rho [Leucobacter zeae]|nr:transcription termination factor Rho [Leucobacter zeae]